MKNNHDWFSLNFWANELEKKYPHTNLLALTDENLAEMLLSLDEGNQ